jgi:hypothetical protein
VSDTLLEVVTSVQIEPLRTGLLEAARSVTSATASIGADFARVANSSETSFAKVEADLAELKADFAQLSSVVTAAMAKVGTSIRAGAEEGESAIAQLRSELTGLAASAELSTTGVASAFGPLGALFGVGLVAHYAEGLKEATLETAHLAELTGESVARLTEFRTAMKELGVESDVSGRLIVHLAEFMQEAADGNKTAQESFDALGVSTQGWSEKLPSAIDVLLQISDAEKRLGGSSETAAAAGRILGLRYGTELAGALGVGSKAIDELMKKYEPLGKAEQAAVSDAERLQVAEVEGSARIQAAMLPLLGIMADVLNGSHVLWIGLKSDFIEAGMVMTASAETIGTSVLGLAKTMDRAMHFDFAGAEDAFMTMGERVANQWHKVAEQVKGDSAEITKALQESTFMPAPPTEGKGKGGAGTGDSSSKAAETLQAWKTEIEQKVEAEASGMEQARRLELELWQQKLAEQQKGSALYLAALREVTKLKAQLWREENADAKRADEERFTDMVAADRDVTALAEAGSQRRVQLEQKTLEDILKVRSATSAEAVNQEKKIVEAQRQADEQTVRDEVSTVEQQVREADKGSQQRVTILTTEMSKLQGLRDAALSNATAAEDASHVRTTDAARQADEFKAESFRSYADFMLTTIKKIQDAFIDAQREMSEASRKAISEDIEQEVKRKVLVTEEGAPAEGGQPEQEGLKDIAANAEEQKQFITDLASLNLISKQQEIEMIRQAQTVQHEADIQKLTDLEQFIALQIQSASAAGADTTKLAEAYRKVFQQIQDENRRFHQEMVQDDQKSWTEQIRDAQRAMEVISSSFTNAFDQMLTQHTKFTAQMEKFWNQMVLGWAKMGIQIVGQYVASLAQIVIHETLTEAQVTAAHSAGITARQATENLWQSILALFGIKTVSQATKTEAQQTTAHGIGLANRQTLDTTDTAKTAISDIGKELEFTKTELAFTTAHAQGIAARSTADVTGDAEAISENATRNYALIISDAGLAGAAAFASVIAALPFPANIAVAPGVAAGAVGDTLAFAAVASAAGGMDVTKDQLVKVHENETILPPPLAEGFKGLISERMSLPTDMLAQLYESMGALDGIGASISQVHENGSARAQDIGAGLKAAVASGGNSTSNVYHNNNHNNSRIQLTTHGATKGEVASAVEEALLPALRKLSRRGDLKGLVGY